MGTAQELHRNSHFLARWPLVQLAACKVDQREPCSPHCDCQAHRWSSQFFLVHEPSFSSKQCSICSIIRPGPFNTLLNRTHKVLRKIECKKSHCGTKNLEQDEDCSSVQLTDPCSAVAIDKGADSKQNGWPMLS
jgi:hypothetical protein